jgi:hypothetical protein
MLTTRIVKKRILGLVLLDLLPATAENCVADPKTGCQILFITGPNYTLTEARWSGSVVDGKAEGKGKLKLTLRDKNGKKFTGNAKAEMKQGKLDGAVELKWSDGESFRGFCRDGKYEGKGLLKYSTGDVYEGDMDDGGRNGYGVYKRSNGEVIYVGLWVDDRIVSMNDPKKFISL